MVWIYNISHVLVIDYQKKFVNENIVLVIFARISKNINKNISYEILLKYHIVSLATCWSQRVPCC